MLENKVFELEQKYNSLRENLQMTDEYSRHIMSTTFTILSIVIVITTSIIIIAAYFIIRQIINNKVELEIENKVLKILRDNPPIYSASGKSAPENDEIILDSDIAGIDELDPNTLIFVSATSEQAVWGNANNNFNPSVYINQNGNRVIKIENYYEENGELSWYIQWTRKKFD